MKHCTLVFALILLNACGAAPDTRSSLPSTSSQKQGAYFGPNNCGYNSYQQNNNQAQQQWLYYYQMQYLYKEMEYLDSLKAEADANVAAAQAAAARDAALASEISSTLAKIKKEQTWLNAQVKKYKKREAIIAQLVATTDTMFKTLKVTPESIRALKDLLELTESNKRQLNVLEADVGAIDQEAFIRDPKYVMVRNADGSLSLKSRWNVSVRFTGFAGGTLAEYLDCLSLNMLTIKDGSGADEPFQDLKSELAERAKAFGEESAAKQERFKAETDAKIAPLLELLKSLQARQ